MIAEQRKAKEVGDIGAIEKHGVNTHRFAVNPYNGERVPIWVANYILMDYGTGAIMSVPAHDERDYEFARKYKLDIRIVIVPRAVDPEETSVEPVLPFTTFDGTLVNSAHLVVSIAKKQSRRCPRMPRRTASAKPRSRIA